MQLTETDWTTLVEEHLGIIPLVWSKSNEWFQSKSRLKEKVYARTHARTDGRRTKDRHKAKNTQTHVIKNDVFWKLYTCVSVRLYTCTYVCLQMFSLRLYEYKGFSTLRVSES